MFICAPMGISSVLNFSNVYSPSVVTNSTPIGKPMIFASGCVGSMTRRVTSWMQYKVQSPGYPSLRTSSTRKEWLPGTSSRCCFCHSGSSLKRSSRALRAPARQSSV